ncbi:FAST kinase domain-containing protein 2, mitochondrial [Phascolarctos cinereus]|uniref:FAST kinase domain-containing protein 2, mitochondrial n=1 Tax=Phascolarctos cinereus TaxID=38626 RepID=A0A6P5M844_PHACI|nr:FAST kinase domain-containing protein 2, mitochondrial [Phascolarctos cinereus]XP_020864342.1 FAST kinase domain-containing protein 2, mitochondrial [Phascolarctos cinereus]XP_020864343.1 FAST kinase domain-containing protein 2, mitochondrial [Phascolarctos cinereus]
MNKKPSSFLWNLRQLNLNICPFGSSSSRRTMKIDTLELHKPKMTYQNITLKNFLFLDSLQKPQSSVRFFCQGMLVFQLEGNEIQKRRLNTLTSTSGVKLLCPRQLSFDSQCFLVSDTTPQLAVDGLKKMMVPTEHDLSKEEKQLDFVKYRNLIQHCNSMSDVLDVFSKFPRFSSCNYFTTMWKIAKNMSEDQRCFERQLLCEHPAFNQICDQVMKEAKTVKLQQLAFTLYALIKIGIPQNTYLVQVLLRIVQERINECDEKCLSVLSRTLEAMEESKNVDALRAGLRLLVDKQIWTLENIFTLQTVMKSIGKDAPYPLKKKIEIKALKELKKFSPVNSQHMFAALAALNHRSLVVLNECSKMVAANIHGCPFWMLMSILQSCKDLLYQNFDLFTAIADYVTATFDMWKMKQVLALLFVFESLRFRHIGLMNLFLKRVLDESQFLNQKEILHVLHIYSSLNHFHECENQQFLEVITSALNTYLPKISSLSLLKAVYCFCVLKHFPQEPFNQLFQENIINELLMSGSESEKAEYMLHQVNACLELEDTPIPKSRAVMLKECSSAPFHPNVEVEDVLLNLLENKRLFLKNVHLAHNYFVDFELRMDSKRSKVFPVSESDVFLAEPDVLRVALLCVSRSAFCFGTSHPRGGLGMKMRHLKALGFHVILVNTCEINKLDMNPAVTFLKNKIFSPEAFPTAPGFAA